MSVPRNYLFMSTETPTMALNVSAVPGGRLPPYYYYRPPTTSIVHRATSEVPRTRTNIGDRSFAVAAGPHLWNNLPLHLRVIL